MNSGMHRGVNQNYSTLRRILRSHLEPHCRNYLWAPKCPGDNPTEGMQQRERNRSLAIYPSFETLSDLAEVRSSRYSLSDGRSDNSQQSTNTRKTTISSIERRFFSLRKADNMNIFTLIEVQVEKTRSSPPTKPTAGLSSPKVVLRVAIEGRPLHSFVPLDVPKAGQNRKIRIWVNTAELPSTSTKQRREGLWWRNIED